MSHFKERKEKNCLNCGAEVQGKYCSVCGQENIEPKESAWHLITHFFNDVTHFDGKFFSTVKYLLLKPGFLTSEYTRGRRMSYLHPIRMYVFTSAFFFLIYFSFISPNKENEQGGVEGLKEKITERKEELSRLKEMLEETTDTVMAVAIKKSIVNYEKGIVILSDSLKKEELNSKNPVEKAQDVLDSVFTYIPVPPAKQNDSGISKKLPAAPSLKSIIDSVRSSIDTIGHQKTDSTCTHKAAASKESTDFIEFDFYKDEHTYLAVQNELPPSRKDGLIQKSISLRLLHWYGQQKKEGGKAFNSLMENFKHSFPKMLFISLPFFALLLKFLYLRRKQFYYADHGIFSLHSYCAIFILLLFYYLLDGIHGHLHWWIFSLMKAAVVIYTIYYVYKAMRNFYQQGRFKTIVKYFLLSWMTLIVMTILMVFFFVLLAYNM